MVKLKRKTERVQKTRHRSRSGRYRDDANRASHKAKVKQKNRAKNRVARKARRISRRHAR